MQKQTQNYLRSEVDFQGSYSESTVLGCLSTAFHVHCVVWVDTCVRTHRWINAIFRNRKGGGKMVWQIRMLAAKPDNLSSILGTYMVEGETWLLQVALWPAHTCLTSPLSETQELVRLFWAFPFWFYFTKTRRNMSHRTETASTAWR